MAQTSTQQAAVGRQPGFRRDVGLMALMFVSLGSIIGSGWLLGALTAATSAGGASIVSWLLAGVIIVLLAFFVGYIFYLGLPVISWHFLTSPPSEVTAGGGIGPEIFNSFYILILTLIFTTPIAMAGGIYLQEYARPGLFTSLGQFCAESLATVPSIGMGLFGLLVFVTMFHWKFTAIGGALTLTLLNLPALMRVTQEALASVPAVTAAMATVVWPGVVLIFPFCSVMLAPGMVAAAVETKGVPSLALKLVPLGNVCGLELHELNRLSVPVALSPVSFLPVAAALAVLVMSALTAWPGIVALARSWVVAAVAAVTLTVCSKAVVGSVMVTSARGTSSTKPR